jgi:hypothetical protein
MGSLDDLSYNLAKDGTVTFVPCSLGKLSIDVCLDRNPIRGKQENRSFIVNFLEFLVFLLCPQFSFFFLWLTF